MTKLANAPLDASMVGYLVGGVVLILAFAAIESRAAEPMLPLSLFRIPTMAASLLASLFQGLAGFGVLFLVLMYLQRDPAAFYASVGFMVLAAVLSGLRARGLRRPG
jgi:hypothetical protein